MPESPVWALRSHLTSVGNPAAALTDEQLIEVAREAKRLVPRFALYPQDEANARGVEL